MSLLAFYLRVTCLVYVIGQVFVDSYSFLYVFVKACNYCFKINVFYITNRDAINVML